jgi:hypothetical protein
VDDDITLSLVGVGWFPLGQAAAAALAVRVRELAAEEDTAAQSFALLFETSLAASVDTIVVDERMTPLLRDALDIVIATADHEPSDQLTTLQRALEP